MKSSIFIAFFLLGMFFQSFSQSREYDKIYKRDGTELEVNIIEVNPIEVKYKKIDDPEGPLFIMLKTEILFIEYKNGDTEEVKNTNTNTSNFKSVLHFGDNIVGINLFGFYSDALTINYERISQSGKFGTKFTFYALFKGLGSGYLVEEKYYFNGQKIISAYAGSGFEYSSVRITDKFYDVIGFSLFAGVSIHPLDFLNLSFDVGPATGFIMGVQRINMLRIGIDMGFRF